ncbi:hypothetical protein DI272_18480 [Streptomyces sp. Act143]|uniref:hypothetical protein n=1 Tax=Streptomyces sp. Act143 TaxID=2200760 RepID=UPI000D672845|nr:hypothetical protein [Streptomyces sp. Act143]PWI15928.1 hypothetical protein DI272_18480 [Streptomyces sp. Act143]
MTVEFSPRRPLADDGPPRQPDDRRYFTRPVLGEVEPVTTIQSIRNLDEIAEGAKCSCEAGDDNPH